MQRVCTLFIGVLFAIPSVAAPFVVPVDPGQSQLSFELCVAGSCDTDSSSVSGTVTIDIESVDVPAQIWLHDFELQLDNDLDLSISWGFFGSLTADATGVAVTYAYPGTAVGPVPVVADGFSFVDVPANAEGVLSYDASGIPCAALQAASMPCSDTQNLADQGTQTLDQYIGTVTSQDRVVTLVSTIDLTVPLIPDSPDVGTLHVYGTVRGSVYVPPEFAVGDLNCDGALNAFDIDPFALALSDQAGYAAAFPDCDRALADANDDGLVNAFDIDPFVVLLTGG